MIVKMALLSLFLWLFNIIDPHHSILIVSTRCFPGEWGNGIYKRITRSKCSPLCLICPDCVNRGTPSQRGYATAIGSPTSDF